MKQLELTVLLCIAWALILLYGEMFAYWVPSLFTCSWPHLRSYSSNSTVDYLKVAVIADPQLMDKTSLHLPPESLALQITEFYTDLYMQRAFFASVLPFAPDVILFLGDYFDGGPYLTDEEWKKSFSRFRHIFGLNEQGEYTEMQVYYIPGNHDIGYEYNHAQKPEVIRRYEETFGVRNYRFSIGKVDFIAVDAQTVDGNREKHLVSKTWEFMKNVSVDGEVHQRVLLTHIPLYRPDDTYCGPHRNREKHLVSKTWEFMKNVSVGNREKHLVSKTWEFMKNVSVDGEVHQRVLLTHIPLYRPDDTYCGPHRNREKHLVSKTWEFMKNVSVGNREKHLVSKTWEFMKNVSVDGEVHQRVLLTHIPLYRPDDTYCGPHRNREKHLVSKTWEFMKNVSVDGEVHQRVLLTHIPLYRPDDTYCGPHRNREKHLVSKTWEFMKNVSVDGEVHQRVLLTHIPLYRPDDTNCGPHRNRKKHLVSKTWEFMKNVSVDGEVHQRVLLTHIPLYRPDDTYCGPHRNSPIINQRVSRTSSDNDIWYQNYVSEDSSKSLMDMIKPKLVLSGHDHDQCTITHQSKFGPIKEHTLGTISWQQGNLYPSFMLVSVSNSTRPSSSTPEDALLTQLCFLPMQTHIYIGYAVLFILTLLATLLWPTSGTSFWHQCCSLVGYSRQLISNALFSGETKEKDEDANYEYEMMWEADGSMHLVKKPLNTSVVNSTERSLGKRGNAVMRPSARKQTSQEGDVSVNMDMASGSGSDPMARIPPRTGRSKTIFIIQRLLRMVRMITVIAAVNVPIYVMLLYKDWIDK